MGRKCKLSRRKFVQELSKTEAWDMNVPVSLSDEETVARVKVLVELGYRNIALSYEVQIPKDNRPVRLPARSAFLNLKSLLKVPQHVKIYSRLTLISEDMSVVRVLRDTNASYFDIVALRPSSEALVTSACEGQIPVDIISFDVTLWTPYTLRHSLLHASGLVCELNYGPMIRDQTSRCGSISFAQVLTTRSRGGGKGLFALSGGLKAPIEARPPADVANLATFLGFKAREGWAAILDAPQAALRRSLARRGILGIEVVKDLDAQVETEPESKKLKLK